MKYLLLISVLSFSGCITIKYLPPPCKKDTIYIEKQLPWWPTYPMPQYPIYLDSVLVLPGMDTISYRTTPIILSDTSLRIKIDTTKIVRYPLIERYCNVDTFYKGIAMKAQQITNEKR